MKSGTKVNIVSVAPKAHHITEEIQIGKDVLDLLAGAMYVNPLDVYREYVQNAADAIDEARDCGLPFEVAPKVAITMNQSSRSVVIRDNGISIPSAAFVRRLTSIGGSKKRGTALRGFRGVGRLSGLGYCQELVFRGRSQGESKVTELRWDGRLLREKLRDKSYTGSLNDLIQAIVTVSTLPALNFPERFFEVELCKVSRLKNDTLLNEEVVRGYLSQVSPAPFDIGFSHATRIDQFLSTYGIRQPIRIEINDGAGEVSRNIRDQFTVREGCADQIRDIEFLEYRGADGDVAAVGWIGDHAYYGALPKKHGLGGIRLRSGNIQVGGDTILADFFPEARFCSWAIGEIHIISAKVLPNGRRDEFEPSVHYSHLQGEFSILAKRITQRIREKSIQRNRLKTINNHLTIANEWLHVALDDLLPAVVRTAAEHIALAAVTKAETESGKMMEEAELHTLAVSKTSEIKQKLHHPRSKNGQLGLVENDSIMQAVRVILESAAKPREGVDLSLRVIEALTSPTQSLLLR